MSHKTPTLFCVGTNHDSAGLDFRETLYLEPDEIEASLPHLMQKHELKEVFVLSTCNRLEIYGVLPKSDVSGNHLQEIFIDLQRFSPTRKPELEDEIRRRSYQHTNFEAARHAFSVASGLDSLVLGETQIAGQFKTSAAKARELGRLGPILHRLTQEAFASSKKVRSQTDIGKKPVSISHAAIDLANRLYGHIDQHSLLIVGAGEMAEVAAKYAIKYNPKQLFIINRTLERAQDLVSRLEFGQAVAWEEMQSMLVTADIIISSTAANDIVIDKDKIKKAQKLRNNRASFLIDIALPRDIDPACADLDDVYLFDIDDLKQVVGENFEERRKAAERGKEIVETSAKHFTHWLSKLSLKPALAEFRQYLDQLFTQERDKSLAKGPLSNLNADQIQALDSLMQSIINKMTGDAGRNLHEITLDEDQRAMADALGLLFPTSSDQEE